MRTRLLLSLLVVSGLMVGSNRGWSQTAPSGRTLVRAGHLLDVHSGKLLDGQTIVVTGDRISAIASTASTPAGSGDTVVDLGTMTVLPGLIDVHTHITMDTEFDPYKELTSTNAKEAINGVVNAKKTLLAGFTSIRNVGALSLIHI